VALGVGVGVKVARGVRVAVSVRVGREVEVGAGVLVSVGVGVTVGVSLGSTTSPPAAVATVGGSLGTVVSVSAAVAVSVGLPPIAAAVRAAGVGVASSPVPRPPSRTNAAAAATITRTASTATLSRVRRRCLGGGPRRTMITVMLSGPPRWRASSISLRAAASADMRCTMESISCGSTRSHSPSEQSRNTSSGSARTRLKTGWMGVGWPMKAVTLTLRAPRASSSEIRPASIWCWSTLWSRLSSSMKPRRTRYTRLSPTLKSTASPSGSRTNPAAVEPMRGSLIRSAWARTAVLAYSSAWRSALSASRLGSA